MDRRLSALALTLAVVSCKGSTSTETTTTVVHDCSLPTGYVAALHATLTVSAPPNGTFFVAGDAPLLSLTVKDDCGVVLAPSALGTANLYVSGPRAPLATVAASKLMNAVTNRAAADRQHHFVNLKAPSYADPAKGGLTVASTGVVTYALQPVSTEAPGTYTAAVWLATPDGAVQAFPQVTFQVGTATVEAYETGPDGSPSCAPCHAGSSGRSYMAHAQPLPFVPLGNPALDAAPLGSCKGCHNADGYSPVSTLQKVHGVHRGANLLNPGGAHAEYGLPQDPTLASYTDVTFSSMPGGERDCAACHADDRWQTRPSRLACGTCHDNVFFDTGALSPPVVYGKPSGVACGADPDCAAFSALASCDVATGSCELAAHPVQTDDTACAGCHGADSSGSSPIADRHAIPERQNAPRLRIVNVTVGGASGENGAFVVGDQPQLTFALADWTGAAVTTAVTDSTYVIEAVVAGPTDGPQRAIVNPAGKGGLSYATGTGLYTWVLPAWPVNALAPLNVASAIPLANAPGGYTLYFSVRHTAYDAQGVPYREAASFVGTVRFATSGSVRARQLVSQAACDGCHGTVSYHGGARNAALACGTCHTAGALDRGVGSQGGACGSNADCAGYAGGWEQCVASRCTVTTDPTPEQTVEYGPMMHKIHFARRRLGGYDARNDLPAAGRVQFLGSSNALVDFSSVLLSVDARECRTCHTSTGAACATTTDCGVGQECLTGRCSNTSWQAASAAQCLSCHASASDYGHAAVNTDTSGGGPPIETCDVCHAPTAAFSVEWAHDMTSTSRPTYPREP